MINLFVQNSGIGEKCRVRTHRGILLLRNRCPIIVRGNCDSFFCNFVIFCVIYVHKNCVWKFFFLLFGCFTFKKSCVFLKYAANVWILFNFFTFSFFFLQNNFKLCAKHGSDIIAVHNSSLINWVSVIFTMQTSFNHLKIIV